MNKHITKVRGPYEPVKGDIITWEGSGTPAGVALGGMHSPSVQVISLTDPVTFEGSFDGEAWSQIRDKDGDLVRVTKPGLYRLPVAVLHLRPVTAGEAVITTFVVSKG